MGGESKAGQLAYLLAFKAKRLLRGACVVDAPLPRTLELPANVPGERLNVLSIETQNASLTLLIAQDVAKLRGAGYPVAQWRRKADNHGETRLDDASRDTIARWLDGLDGF